MLYMLEDGLVFSVDDTRAEISRAVLGDLKCELKGVDVVYFDSNQEKCRLLAVHPVQPDKAQPTFALFF